MTRKCIDYYLSGGNDTVCVLDLSKVYDRVSHYCLLSKLLDNDAPVYFVRLLRSWYTSQLMQVRWRGCLSHSFTVQKWGTVLIKSNLTLLG